MAIQALQLSDWKMAFGKIPNCTTPSSFLSGQTSTRTKPWLGTMKLMGSPILVPAVNTGIR